MLKDEIFRYIKLGRNKSISVHRCILEDYPGIMRNVVIREDAELQVDFLDKNALENDEGEVTLYFYYESYEKLFKAIEDYIGINMDDWLNYSSNSWYPSLEVADLPTSWRKFKIDFADKEIPLPTGFVKQMIPTIYWEGLYNGEIKVDDSKEAIREWLRRKMLEEEETYYED